jgi:Protein of unknown function (DUF3237)
MSELRSRPLFSIRMTLHPMHELGQTPMGRRRIVPVREGTFEGDRLRGTVRTDAGGDWLLLRADGTYQMDVRLTLETHDGALVLMCYRGVRHASEDVAARIARGEAVPASEYYLRSTPFFETADPRYTWLNNLVAVGVGDRRPDGVSYEVYEIL